MGRSEWNKKNRDSAKGLFLTPLLGKSWPLGVLTAGVLAAGPWSSGLGTLLTASLAHPRSLLRTREKHTGAHAPHHSPRVPCTP